MSDAASYGGMVGVGETYFAAFALAIGLGEIAAGLVSSIPLLIGGVLQLVSLRAVRLFGNEQRWIVICATLQGLAFIPLVAAALLGSMKLVPLLLVVSLYWTGGLAGGPPWNTWMDSIVPPRVRSKYFARRSRSIQLCTLLGLVGGGLLLRWTDSRGDVLVGFATIFILALVFRFWSITWLLRHRTPRQRTSSDDAVRSVIASTPAKKARLAKWHLPDVTPFQLLAFVVAIQASVQISGPYFASYMLKQLHLSYGEFVALLAIAFLSKILALSWWGKLSREYGTNALLWIGAFGIIPLSSLWILGQNVIYLAAVQALSGFIWAAYELGFCLLVFEKVPIERRTGMLTYYNLANMLAWCGGAFIGACLLKQTDTSLIGYWWLFGASTAFRFLALAVLLVVVHSRDRIRSIRYVHRT
jgi:hypothetical protein